MLNIWQKMKYRETVGEVEDSKLLEEEILTLLNNQPLHLWDNQLCLTHPKNCEDKWYYGSGSKMYITENIQKFKQYNREIPLNEEDFTEINEGLGSYTTQLLTFLKEKYMLGRIRIMVNARKHALTWHKDTEDRIHIPVITHEGCRMVIEDESFHMPAGGIFKVNTTGNYHSAFNGSPIDKRIHIVGCVI